MRRIFHRGISEKIRIMEKTDIKSLNLEELTAFITASGEKAFRAKQLYEWMHKKLAPGYEEMTNLPKSLKERLKETYRRSRRM